MMMADLATPRMTVDEFLGWAEGQDGRWELQDGAPVSMSPERVAHTETKGEAYSALKNAIAVARAPCRALTEGAAVRIDAGPVWLGLPGLAGRLRNAPLIADQTTARCALGVWPRAHRVA
jgi:Putative restriction endonuclease